MISQTIQNIIDQISRNETQAALHSLNQLMKKEKKNQKLTHLEQTQITILRAQIFVMEKYYGEAQEILEKIIGKQGMSKQEIDPGHHFFLQSIAKELDLMGWVINALSNQLINMNKSDSITDLYHFYLTDHNFVEASKLVLKLYKLNGEKDHNLLFEYLYLLAESNTQTLGGKISVIFAEKIEKLIGLDRQKSNFEGVQPNYLGLGKQLINFEMRLAKTLREVPQVKDLLIRFPKHFQQYEEQLEHLMWIYKNDRNQNHLQQLIEANMQLFQSHLKNFIMNFDAQERFIDFLFDQIINQTSQTQEKWNAILGKLTQSQGDQINLFSSQITDELDAIVNIYISSINLLNTKDLQVSKSIHYTLLGLLNRFHVQLANTTQVPFNNFPQLQEDLKNVITSLYRFNGDKFSFLQEFFQSVKDMVPNQEFLSLVDKCIQKEHLQLPHQAKESKVIRNVNLAKLKFMILYDQPFQSENGIFSEILFLLQSYNSADKQLYQEDYKLEKGERLLQDDFILIIIDLLIVKDQISNKKRENYIDYPEQNKKKQLE